MRGLVPGRTQAETSSAGGKRGSLVQCGRCGKREKGLARGVHAGDRHVQLVPAAPTPTRHAHPPARIRERLG